VEIRKKNTKDLEDAAAEAAMTENDYEREHWSGFWQVIWLGGTPDPIDEAGEITSLYEMIRKWIEIEQRIEWPNAQLNLPQKQRQLKGVFLNILFSGAQIENVNGRGIPIMDF
jgi:hypothetical protein